MGWNTVGLHMATGTSNKKGNFNSYCKSVLVRAVSTKKVPCDKSG